MFIYLLVWLCGIIHGVTSVLLFLSTFLKDAPSKLARQTFLHILAKHLQAHKMWSLLQLRGLVLIPDRKFSVRQAAAFSHALLHFSLSSSKFNPSRTRNLARFSTHFSLPTSMRLTKLRCRLWLRSFSHSYPRSLLIVYTFTPATKQFDITSLNLAVYNVFLCCNVR